MAAELVDVAVRVVRFVDDSQPGIVACELVDAGGHGHILIDMAPIFTDESLHVSSEYPPGPASSDAPLCGPGETNVGEI